MAATSEDALEITPMPERPESVPLPASRPASRSASRPASRSASITGGRPGSRAGSRPASRAGRQRPSKPLTLDTQLLSGRTTPDGGASLHRQEAKIETATTASIVPANPTLTKIPKTPAPIPQPSSLPQHKTHDLHSDLHWEISPSNPRNWAESKKWWHLLVVSATAWVISLASSVLTPAHDALMNDLDTPLVAAVLPTSIYLLGLTCGPMLSSACVEIYGRKTAYAMCIPFFSSFILASALVTNDYGLIILRFLAGMFGSPGLHAGWGTVSDMWTPEQHNEPLTVYITMVFLGSTCGPVLGGYLTWKMTWAWTQFVVLFAFALCVVPILAMRETSRKAIIQLREDKPARAAISRDFLLTTYTRPFRMLFAEPIVMCYSTYAAFNSGVLYAIYTAFPSVFARRAGFDLGAQGLSFLGMSVGVMIGCGVIIGWGILLYNPAAKKHNEKAIGEEENNVRDQSRASEKKLTGSGLVRPQSSMSRSGLRSENRRSTLMRRLQALRKFSVARSSSPESFSATPFRNYKLALAASGYLNEHNSDGQFIVPEQVLALLDQDLDYDQLCKALQSYGLRVDRVKLAKVLVRTLKPDSGTPESERPSPSGSALAAAVEEHRRATLAALGSSECSYFSPSVASSTIVTNKRTNWLSLHDIAPPQEWRLWLALPTPVLLTGSLFMLGWTARSGTHFMAPIIAFSIFAFSSLLIFMSMTQYVMACYSPSESAHAVAVCTMAMCLCGFVFPLFTLPMYRGIQAGWATSVFAFASIILGLIPYGLYWLGPRFRQSRSRGENS